MKKKKKTGGIILDLILILISLTYILPIIMMISISFSSEQSIIDYGYSLFPKQFSTEAYRLAFRNPQQLIQSYKVTIGYTVLGTAACMVVQSLMAYPLSRRSFRYKKPMLVFLLITMFFNGGLVPTYILITQYLKLGNSFWVYIFPSVMNAWNVILFKTYFAGLPESLIEAAKIDGANEYRIYFRLIVPLSLPIFATLAFTTALVKWNDWNTSMLYVRDNSLYALQYLLQRIINETDYIKKLQGSLESGLISQETMPSESLRYVMAVLAAGPMMVVFPFFQKYFAKGLVVGSVKG